MRTLLLYSDNKDAKNEMIEKCSVNAKTEN